MSPMIRRFALALVSVASIALGGCADPQANAWIPEVEGAVEVDFTHGTGQHLRGSFMVFFQGDGEELSITPRAHIDGLGWSGLVTEEHVHPVGDASVVLSAEGAVAMRFTFENDGPIAPELDPRSPEYIHGDPESIDIQVTWQEPNHTWGREGMEERSVTAHARIEVVTK